MAPSSSPGWTVENSGSFASVQVSLPAGSSINCESDAVVTFSNGILVKGVVSGGLLGGLARLFFTKESFFTTKVENTSFETDGDVMMAPSDPGGIVLHRLLGSAGADGNDLLLTRGAYVASDSGVKISSEVQSRIKNSLLSGTGFFLLRASGRGTVACAAYGSVHQYTLRAGEVRAIDNGHLVAWTASMKYRVGFASGPGGGGVWSSMTSGEGLMCFFEGPGTVYLQSHKPGEADTVVRKGKSGARNTARAGMAVTRMLLICVLTILLFMGSVIYLASTQGLVKVQGGDHRPKTGYNPQKQPHFIDQPKGFEGGQSRSSGEF